MFKEMPLTQGKFAIVDVEDYESLSRWSWCFDPTGYAKRKARIDGKQVTILLHRFLMNPAPGYEVDHINGIKLDNRRTNLRIVTSQQNKMNRHKSRGVSKFKGVYWHKQRSKWCARIKVDRKYLHLGLFIFEPDAAKAYNAAATEMFGEYARLNQI